MWQRHRRRLRRGSTLFDWLLAPAVVLYAAALWRYRKLRAEHVVILSGWLALSYLPRVRRSRRGLLPFFLFLAIYDSLRFVTPTLHRLIPPHVAGPFELERRLFGVAGDDGQRRIPSEILARVKSPPLLLVTGFSYLFYIYEVFLFGIVLTVVDRDLLRRFGWGFLGLSLMGFATWYLYPAAPPWYVATYGTRPAAIDTPASAARLVELDRIVGFQLFGATYSRSANVFGAVPSLHAADPLLVWLFARHLRIGRWHWLFFGFAELVAFSAVLLKHHYVIDVLLGSAYAVIAYAGAEALLRPGAGRRRLSSA